MKQCVLFIVAFLSVIIVSCCANKDDAKDHKRDVVFGKYIMDPVHDLDPLRSYEIATTNVVTQIFDSLFELDSALEPVPHLIESFTYDAGKNQYHFHLRKNIHFTNGKELTSDDVLFTFRRFCTQNRGDLKLTEVIDGCAHAKNDRVSKIGVQYVDKYGFDIKLVSHYPPFLVNLASHNFAILPDNFAGLPEAEYWKKPISTGAYVLESMSDKLITLRANGDYFKGRPDIDLIRYVDVAQDKVVDLATKKEIDDTWPFDLDSPPSPEFKQYKAHVATICFLGFNIQKYPYNNLWFRKAISSLIDRERIALLMKPAGIRKAGGFIPYGTLGYLPSAEAQKPDLDLFKKYMRLAGFNDIKRIPPLNLYTTAPLAPPNIYDEIKRQLEEAGLKVNVHVYSLTGIVEKVKTEGPLDFSLLKIRLNQPDTYHLLEYFRSNYSLNFFNNKDRNFDAILDISQRYADRIERGKLYEEANRMITDNAWAIGIFYEISRTAYINKRFNVPTMNYLGPEFVKIRDIKVTRAGDK